MAQFDYKRYRTLNEKLFVIDRTESNSKAFRANNVTKKALDVIVPLTCSTFTYMNQEPCKQSLNPLGFFFGCQESHKNQMKGKITRRAFHKLNET